MESLLTQVTDADRDRLDPHLQRAAQISDRIQAMPKSSRRGAKYLMLMASGQLLTVIWPVLKARSRNFRSIEILDDQPGSEFRQIDRHGADAVINPIMLPNNTVPVGTFYGVRMLWGQQAPQMPVIRLRAARLTGTEVDADTDVLKIYNGHNITQHQLTGRIIPQSGRKDWEFSGAASWIASLPTHEVAAVLEKNRKIVDCLEEARCAGSSRDGLLWRLGLEDGRVNANGASLVLDRDVIWFDVWERISVIAS
jgi:hypothetical protein